MQKTLHKGCLNGGLYLSSYHNVIIRPQVCLFKNGLPSSSACAIANKVPGIQQALDKHWLHK